MGFVAVYFLFTQVLYSLRRYFMAGIRMGQYKTQKAENGCTKGKIFTKIGREIAIVVKQGGPDPEVNSSSRMLLPRQRLPICPMKPS